MVPLMDNIVLDVVPGTAVVWFGYEESIKASQKVQNDRAETWKESIMT